MDKTNRAKIEELQTAMQADQAAVAKELVELIAGDLVRDLIAELTALRERTIPGQALDQQLSATIANFAALGQNAAGIYQQLSRA